MKNKIPCQTCICLAICKSLYINKIKNFGSLTLNCSILLRYYNDDMNGRWYNFVKQFNKVFKC